MRATRTEASATPARLRGAAQGARGSPLAEGVKRRLVCTHQKMRRLDTALLRQEAGEGLGLLSLRMKASCCTRPRRRRGTSSSGGSQRRGGHRRRVSS